MWYRILQAALLALTSCLPFSAQAQNIVAGYERTRLADGAEVGIWYPARGVPTRQSAGLYELMVVRDAPPLGTRLPLIVMSHGSGGQYLGHHDTAEALARAGFVVAALTHVGDNYRDQSRATDMPARAAALSALVSYMLDDWRSRQSIDRTRIGAFGFSAGAFTVLAAAGAVPDLSLIAGHCAAHPEAFECRLVRANPGSAVAWQPRRDPRIRAIVVAAPALGYTFTAAGSRDVTIPVQLWRAAEDDILRAPFYAEAVRAALPRRAEFHDVPGARHFDFLAPCATAAPPLPICAPTPGFDRAAFHQQFNRQVTRFFRRHLRR